MQPWQQRPVVLLGATGSIGASTLDVCQTLAIPVHAVTAHSKVAELAAIAVAAKASVAVIADPTREAALRDALAGTGIQARAGAEAVVDVAADPAAPCVMTAIVGAAGLAPTLAAVRAGKRVCVANKEPLVMAGELVMREAKRCGAEILPVDSEHSAIFQCLHGHQAGVAERIILTGSGGPLRTVADLSEVSIEQALAHPTWSMGPKITIDSATLMNKSLEIIEARWLFDLPVDQIDLVIHPQSVVHSMVAFGDGSVMAQLGLPDMRTPIQIALTWPQHVPGSVAAPDFTTMANLTFEAPDLERFPSVKMGRESAARGGLAPTVMNAANEVAVADFLAGKLSFTGIFDRVGEALAQCPNGPADDIDAIVAADAETRRAALSASP